MFEPPYELISCSWPHPLQQVDGRWAFELEWDVPQMSIRPELYWEEIHGELCWTVNWSRFFRSHLFRHEHSQRFPLANGEMLGFSIIFCIKIRASGILVIWNDERSIMRLNGQIIRKDCNASPVLRYEIKVNEGDTLEIAQMHFNKNWQWSARLISERAI